MDIKGVASPNDLLDNYNSLIFVINQFIKNTINTVELVRVDLINDDGTIDVIPVVKRETADGTYAENGIIPNVKYIQYQAGTNAIIVKPQVGDIGLLLINKRDISNALGGVVATNRMFNPCDGIYLGGVFGLNQQPEQILEFNENGISITSPTKLSINAPEVEVNASTSAIITSPLIELGGSGGQGIARIGDSVDLQTGKIISGSTAVKSL